MFGVFRKARKNCTASWHNDIMVVMIMAIFKHQRRNTGYGHGDNETKKLMMAFK